MCGVWKFGEGAAARIDYVTEKLTGGRIVSRMLFLQRAPEADSTLPLPFWALCFASVFGSDALNLISLIEKSQGLNRMDGANRCIP